MASIPLEVVRRAAALYRKPGVTWNQVSAQIEKEYRRRYHPYRLRLRCKAEDLLAADGNCLCRLCKTEFKPEKILRHGYCDSCKQHNLPTILSARRRLSRNGGAYA